QRLAFIESHNNEGMTIRRFFNTVNNSYVWVVERGGRARFAQKSFFIRFRGQYFVGQKLQRNQPLQLNIECAVNHSHASRRGKAQYLVVAYAVACGKRADCVRHPLSPDSSPVCGAKVLTE